MRSFGLTLMCVVLGAALVSCSPARRISSEPAVRAAERYARALPAVLGGGELSGLKSFATTGQVERVGRYRMLLEGERAQVLGTRLDGWVAQTIEQTDETALVTARESWTTQPLEVGSGQPAGPAESRQVVTEYQLVLVDGVWLVDDLAERAAERE